MRATSALRHPVSGYALGVLLPSALIVLPSLYMSGPLRQFSAYLGAFYFLLLSAIFIGHVRRVARLKKLQVLMPTYDGPYVVLMRSFGRTEGYEKTARDPGPDDMLEGPRESSEIGDLEAAVRARSLRLVALGGEFLLPAEHGLFWLTTRDDDWERNFLRLARGAAAFVICPETTQGIRREIVLLKDWAFLDKAVFFMAPTPKAKNWLVSAFHQYDEPEARAQRWAQQCDDFRAEGIELPAYDELGLFFTLGKNLKIARSTPARSDADFLSLLPTQVDQPASFSTVFAELALDRPIYDEVNWLHPPGTDQSLLRASMLSAMWALFFNAFAIAVKLFG